MSSDVVLNESREDQRKQSEAQNRTKMSPKVSHKLSQNCHKFFFTKPHWADTRCDAQKFFWFKIFYLKFKITLWNNPLKNTIISYGQWPNLCPTGQSNVSNITHNLVINSSLYIWFCKIFLSFMCKLIYLLFADFWSKFLRKCTL